MYLFCESTKIQTGHSPITINVTRIIPETDDFLRAQVLSISHQAVLLKAFVAKNQPPGGRIFCEDSFGWFPRLHLRKAHSYPAR